MALVCVLVVLAGGLWALARGPDSVRRVAARSLRSALGPPTPAGHELDLGELDLGEGQQPSPLVRPSLPTHVVPIAELGPEPPPPQRPAQLEGVSFVLLLGADNRSDRVVGRTDAMILAAFRERDGKVAAFSVPRDLWVDLPDVGTLHAEGRDHARISSVIRVGEVRLGPGQGLPLLRRVLHEQLGVRVDRYARVDFRGFEALVDEIGGVEVEVACPIMDCFWNAGPDQPCEMMTLDAGRQRMDGATALAYVRSRHGTGDRDRTRRQQAVMLGFARAVRGRGLRGIRGLWQTAAPYVDTDLEANDAAYYASFALDNDLSEVRGFAITKPLTHKHVTEDGKHVVVLEREVFDRALADLFDDELPALRERKQCPAPDAALDGRN